jgi:CheY-like chemotaxis protein
MHGGSISVQSEAGKGAVFVVELPFKQASPEILGEKPAEKKQRVLIVDDEPSVLQLISHLVNSWGYESVTASNGKDALKIAGDSREKIEMIVMDVNMPHPDGLETARSLNENKSLADIPVIFLTARADDFEESGKPSNVCSVLRKPFDYQELHQSLFIARNAR